MRTEIITCDLCGKTVDDYFELAMPYFDRVPIWTRAGVVTMEVCHDCCVEIFQLCQKIKGDNK